MSLGGYLLERLAEPDLPSQVHFLEDLPGTAAGDQELLASVRAADLLVLSFPLYVDAPPAPVIRAMGVMAEGGPWGRPAGREPGFVTIVNCGFPEARHADVALAISRRFAAAARLRWLGGLAMGLGGMLGGRPLAEGDARLGHIKRGLELAAAALAGGEPVPELARELLARPVVTPARFVAMGNRGWSAKAEERGLKDRLRDQPYRRME
jgi:hypothetical protein